MGTLTHLGFIAVVLLVTFSTECEAHKHKEGKHKMKKYEYDDEQYAHHGHGNGLMKHSQMNKEQYPSPPSHKKMSYHGMTKEKSKQDIEGMYDMKKHGMTKEESKQDIEMYDMKKHSKHNLNRKEEHFDEDKQMKLKMKKLKGKKFKHGDLDWMKFKPEADCNPKCRHNEVCISSPVDSKKTFCVTKKNLKKSIKLFHRYQKKEMKEWRKFKKDHYNDVYNENKHYNEKETDLIEMKEQYLHKHGHDHMKEKKEKEHHHSKLLLASSGDDGNECTTGDFGEMRTRMMGWFHVLHGQDHLMKKQDQKVSLKHFHKHVSVKKELREHAGESCQCFKSAMWQFHEMDENKNNELDDKELRMVEENSLEPCVKPYLTSCDKDANGVLSADEWCCCFSSVVAPCFKKLDEIRKSGDTLSYVPRCDKEGYYMREQCQGDSKESDSYGCWCVDYNGNEYKDTFTKGRAHCSKIALKALGKTPMI